MRLASSARRASPTREADQGTHRLAYALLPGATIADAVAGGYALNLPLRVVARRRARRPRRWSRADGDGVAIEAVKLADDRSGDVVVRLYECLGGRAVTRLRAAFPVERCTVSRTCWSGRSTTRL